MTVNFEVTVTSSLEFYTSNFLISALAAFENLEIVVAVEKPPFSISVRTQKLHFYFFADDFFFNLETSFFKASSSRRSCSVVTLLLELSLIKYSLKIWLM